MRKNIFTLLLSSMVATMGMAQAPTTNAPNPERLDSLVKSAYSDAYSQFTKWDQYSWSKCTFSTFYPVDDSNKVLKLSDLSWAAISLGGRDVHNMTYLHLDVFTPSDSAVVKMSVGFAGFSGGEVYSNSRSITAGQWNQLDIPLKEFSGYNFYGTAVLRLRKDDGTKQKTLYHPFNRFRRDYPCVIGNSSYESIFCNCDRNRLWRSGLCNCRLVNRRRELQTE